MSTLSLNNIVIHPVKSLNGIEVKEAAIEEKGLRFDRRWMLINENGVAITQRTFPKLVFVKVSLEDDLLTISDRNINQMPISFNIHEHGEKVEVKVWDDVFKACEIKPELNQWFSDFLEKPVRLMKVPFDSTRVINQKYNTESRSMGFQDSSPVLITFQESLDDLNSKMETPVPMHRFRSNLIVSGLDPYEEDDISWLQINGIVFKIFKSCSRCIFTTIDQETGQSGAEPLKTLSSYRQKGSNILFGASAYPENDGTIDLTSEVKVLD